MDWKKGAQYWDKCWNPIIGCSPISEGCRNCYAESMAKRFPELQDETGGFLPHPPKAPKAPPKSGVVFVGNMTDLFGEWNTFSQVIEWINSLSENAVNLLLTKRPKNMLFVYEMVFDRKGIWFGMTAENQSELINRVVPFSEATGDCIKTRWLSAEPLLGPLDLMATAQIENEHNEGYGCEIIKAFDWVVVGAESGPYRRPCNLELVESVVEQCQSAGVPVFVKQLDIGGKLIKDIEKFPEHLRIRQVPWGGKE